VAGLVLWCAGLIGVAGAATITEFAIPTAFSGPAGIAAGPDGALWFTDFADKSGRITTAPLPPPPAIPTLTEWGMVSLAGLLAGVMAMALRGRSAPKV
jgi:hypothetical protein